ncbi:MAG: hypothetical protein LBD04_03625 [Synergistaceae bacterium]|jgi:phosphoribosylformylglycinamidine cyclo-ligase|nr:hypothetical protein [Synergistaceae bacterium]
MSGLSYWDAGVDVDAGNRVVEEIREVVRSTYRSEVLGDLGEFSRRIFPNIESPSWCRGQTGLGRSCGSPL